MQIVKLVDIAMKTINIMLIDDHAILRSGLKMLINNEKDLKVVAEAGSAKEAIEKLKSLSPDMVILDITLPDMNGIEVVKFIKEKRPKTKIIVLTIHENEYYLKEFLKLGVNGYVTKRSADTELINAIHTARRGGVFVDPALVKFLIEGNPEKRKKLSPREVEVLKLLVRGYTNKEIALALGISVKTVEAHRKRISEKLEVSSRAELVEFAIKNGLFDIT